LVERGGGKLGAKKALKKNVMMAQNKKEMKRQDKLESRKGKINPTKEGKVTELRYQGKKRTKRRGRNCAKRVVKAEQKKEASTVRGEKKKESR